ncbi:ABC transporter, permease protein [Treponema primitia ZAS-2]|uniref:ABC transporter, permease protein n=1 Tax=Treponema primitia (strain ATCC BAA-887 / DSM 12427 / ZAS-2) TaxID=545694 RepID=F5YLF8_TREPZ|nr:ABC transporter permease [Treponema primitia]AEF85260.1 ABC transporter, permease protein [Treponema primitia ZAS-2]
MKAYLFKKITQMVVVLLGITLVVFSILHLVGDPVQLLLPPSASQENVEQLREEMGFNDPLLVQYGRFLSGIFRGDFGMSYNYNQPALSVVLERVPQTLKLAGIAFLISLVIGIPTGVLSAIKQDTVTDAVIRVLSFLGQCTPSFLLGIMMMLLFSVKLKWLPTSGNDGWKNIIMPSLTLGLFSTATIIRLLRSNMIEVMEKEFIEVARAKGLKYRLIVWKHGFKNAFSSVMTVLGMQIVSLMGGAVIIETVFAWPGIGRLAVQSIRNNDFMVTETIVILMASCFVVMNLIVDLLYAVINPRVKVQ